MGSSKGSTIPRGASHPKERVAVLGDGRRVGGTPCCLCGAGGREGQGAGRTLRIERRLGPPAKLALSRQPSAKASRRGRANGRSRPFLTVKVWPSSLLFSAHLWKVRPYPTLRSAFRAVRRCSDQVAHHVPWFKHLSGITVRHSALLDSPEQTA